MKTVMTHTNALITIASAIDLWLPNRAQVQLSQGLTSAGILIGVFKIILLAIYTVLFSVLGTARLVRLPTRQLPHDKKQKDYHNNNKMP